MASGAQRSPDGLEGKTLDDRFEVAELLGEGGLGTVYRALDRQLGRPVALKVLIPRYRGRELREARLFAEAELSRCVSHPRVVRCLDSGRLQQLSGCPYATFELVTGRSLNLRLAYGPSVDQRQAAQFVRELAGLVQACHDAGVVHRDVTVHNVFLEDDDALTLIDFSHAARLEEPGERMTLVGEVPGAPWYMSPEQARGEQAAPSMDVFAVGVVAYELLLGRNPYRDVQVAAFAELQGKEELRPPKIDRRIHPEIVESLATAVNGCFALRAAERTTLPELMRLLDVALAELQPESATPTEPAIQLVRSGGPSVVAEGARPAGDATMAQLVREGIDMPAAHRIEAMAETLEGIADERVVLPAVEFRAALAVAQDDLPTEAQQPDPPQPIPPSAEAPAKEATPPRSRSKLAVVVLAMPALAVGLWLGLTPPRPSALQPFVVASVVTPAVPAETDAPAVQPSTPELPKAEPKAAEPLEVREPPHRKPKRKSKSRPPVVPSANGPADKPDPLDVCAENRANANRATKAKKWKAVLAATKDAACWASKEDRVLLRARAWLKLGRMKFCIREAAGYRSPEIVDVYDQCYRHDKAAP